MSNLSSAAAAPNPGGLVSPEGGCTPRELTHALKLLGESDWSDGLFNRTIFTLKPVLAQWGFRVLQQSGTVITGNYDEDYTSVRVKIALQLDDPVGVPAGKTMWLEVILDMTGRLGLARATSAGNPEVHVRARSELSLEFTYRGNDMQSWIGGLSLLEAGSDMFVERSEQLPAWVQEALTMDKLQGARGAMAMHGGEPLTLHERLGGFFAECTDKLAP